VFPIVAAICFSVGGWWVFRSVQALIRGVRSRRWPVTEGEVRSVKVVKKFNRRGREIWREELEYKYSVGGIRHRGTRRQFGVPARYDWNHGHTEPLQRGDRVEVIYRAANPGLSALQRGASPFALIPLVLGAGIVWAGVRLLLV
jgi:hypothetical protein